MSCRLRTCGLPAPCHPRTATRYPSVSCVIPRPALTWGSGPPRPRKRSVGTVVRRTNVGEGMTDWNFGAIYAAVAARAPDRPCQIQGDRVVTWREFDERSDSIAADLLANGVT